MFADKIFKNYKRSYKEREKILIQQSLRKLGLCFMTSRLIKPFKIAINFFYINFTSSSAAQCLIFDIRMTQELSKGEIGNDK